MKILGCNVKQLVLNFFGCNFYFLMAWIIKRTILTKRRCKTVDCFSVLQNNIINMVEFGNASQLNASESAHLQINACNSVESIRETAAKLCKDYLHGSWRKIQPEEMILKKVSGGLSNLLYYCALPPEKQTTNSEPSRVLLRIYGQINGERALETLITESVIFTLLSESQKGPRLFGVFPGGRLEEYISARPLKTKELADPKLSALIAEKMVQIHQMDVPINKQPEWFWKTTEGWLKRIEEDLKNDSEKMFDAMKEKIEKLQLREELAWLRKFLLEAESPVVFCHNDLQEGNILLRQDNNESFQRKNMTDIPASNSSKISITQSNKSSPYLEDEDKIPANLTCKSLVIIDFEYCSYNYRGFDFANHFNEWLYDYTNEEPPFFFSRPEEEHPTIAQKEHLIRNYLQVLQSHPSYKPRSKDTVEHVMAETNAFILASHFFWGLWSVVNSTSSEISFDYWGYGEARFDAYFKHKANFIRQPEKENEQSADASSESKSS